MTKQIIKDYFSPITKLWERLCKGRDFYEGLETRIKIEEVWRDGQLESVSYIPQYTSVYIGRWVNLTTDTGSIQQAQKYINTLIEEINDESVREIKTTYIKYP